MPEVRALGAHEPDDRALGARGRRRRRPEVGHATHGPPRVRARAERELTEAIGVPGDGVTVTADAFLDEPADALVRVSEHLDLLVCGSRGFAPLRAVLAGGVSRRLAADTHCPVIVLPR